MTQRIAGFEFARDLHLVRFAEGRGTTFVLGKKYRVRFTLTNDEGIRSDEKVSVEKGFATDLASIPKLVPRWIAQKVDKNLEAAVIHDWLYASHQLDGGREIARDLADEIFLAAMEAAQVHWLRAWLMHLAVRLFGGGPWRRGADKGPTVFGDPDAAPARDNAAASSTG